MYENNIENIKRAKSGDEEAMTKLIKDNNRTNLEYCKKVFIKGIWSRRFLSNRLHGIH